MTIPYSLDAERSVLGAMMDSPDAIHTATDTLTPEDFYSQEHRTIFATICDLYTRGEATDTTAVGKDRSIDKNLLLDCLQSHSTSSAVKTHAEMVRSDSILRGLIRVGSEMVSLAQSNGDASELLDKAESLVFALADKSVDEIRPISELVRSALDFIEAGEAEGTSTGFAGVDEMLTLCPARLYLVAARPGVGKSAWLSDITLSIARSGGPVAVFSLEMTHEEMMTRFLSSVGSVDSHAIRRGTLSEDEWGRLAKAGADLSNLPLFVDDSANLSLLKLRAKCRRIKARHGLALVIVDYLQLMATAPAETREREIANLSRGLKLLAKDLNVPVVVATQLNRMVEARTDKTPRLSDLRESGAQEADGDAVILLSRPGMYDVESDDPTRTEVIIAKNRHGPVGPVELTFQPKYTRFSGSFGGLR